MHALRAFIRPLHPGDAVEPADVDAAIETPSRRRDDAPRFDLA